MIIRTTSGDMDDPIDGVDVINIYSRGVTALGRGLSHMSYFKFEIPNIGPFPSMEHYWYWCKTGKCYGEFRQNISPWEAKRIGRTKPIVHNENFMDDIVLGELWRLKCNPKLADAFFESELPFTHYFTLGGNPNGSKRNTPNNQWFWVEYLAELRAAGTLDAM